MTTMTPEPDGNDDDSDKVFLEGLVSGVEQSAGGGAPSGLVVDPFADLDRE